MRLSTETLEILASLTGDTCAKVTLDWLRHNPNGTAMSVNGGRIGAGNLDKPLRWQSIPVYCGYPQNTR